MADLDPGLAKRIAEELEHVGEWGRVVLFIAHGNVSRVEGTRSSLIVDDRQPALMVER